MDKTKEEIKKIMKPKVLTGIMVTLICLGPFGHLILDITIKNYSKILVDAILSLPTLIFIGVYWCWHIIKTINLNRDVEEIYDYLTSNDKNIDKNTKN